MTEKFTSYYYNKWHPLAEYFIMHESHAYHKWLKGEYHSLGQPEAELQSYLVITSKLSFSFTLLLYDPIWQLHPLAGRISPSSVIRVFICLHQDSTVRHASMIFALNTILIYTFSDCSSCMHGFFKCIIIFPLPG